MLRDLRANGQKKAWPPEILGQWDSGVIKDALVAHVRVNRIRAAVPKPDDCITASAGVLTGGWPHPRGAVIVVGLGVFPTKPRSSASSLLGVNAAETSVLRTCPQTAWVVIWPSSQNGCLPRLL
jgi:hypothetical protein